VSKPPRTLTYTWPNPEEEQGSAPPERLTWEITSTGPGVVTLKLIHERLSEEYYQGVSKGWPTVFAAMKTLLETRTPVALKAL
jgi:uncharacterized protein YndB with AHSA1/START domain